METNLERKRNLDIENFLNNVDRRILHTLDDVLDFAYKRTNTYTFIHDGKIHKDTPENDYSLSSLDYLVSKVKELYLQNLLFEIKILEDGKRPKRNCMNADQFSSLLVFDITDKKLKKLNKDQLKEMKYRYLDDDESKESGKKHSLFDSYHNLLMNIGNNSLMESLNRKDPFYSDDAFVENIKYHYQPELFLKKDMAFLYSESKSSFRKVRNKEHKYLQRFSTLNFYYTAFLINEFNRQNTAFKCPSTFLKYLDNYAFEQYWEKWPSKTHEKHNRDFDKMISTYNRHINSANEYKDKLVDDLVSTSNKSTYSDTGKINTSSLLNYYYLVNNVLRTDFFSSISTPFVLNTCKKISIKKLYISAEKRHLKPTIQGLPQSMNTFVYDEEFSNTRSRDFFYLNLLELLMLFNIDTHKLSSYYFYEIKSDVQFTDDLYELPDELYILYLKVIFKFLNMSYDLIFQLLQEGIRLYKKLSNNDVLILIQMIQDELNDYYGINYDYLMNEVESSPFTSIPNDVLTLYESKTVDNQLVISYLLNSCARNRTLLDYLYIINPVPRYK